jgi:hypothetical protein
MRDGATQIIHQPFQQIATCSMTHQYPLDHYVFPPGKQWIGSDLPPVHSYSFCQVIQVKAKTFNVPESVTDQRQSSVSIE